MEFVETSIFERVSKEFLTEHELNELQILLSSYPDIGSVIPGSGGLRKLRWASVGTGKRGGLRIIYYLMMADNAIYLLYLYKKSRLENLDLEYLRYLRTTVEDK